MNVISESITIMNYSKTGSLSVSHDQYISHAGCVIALSYDFLEAIVEDKEWEDAFSSKVKFGIGL